MIGTDTEIAELKKAHAAGAVIEYKVKRFGTGRWMPIIEPSWNSIDCQYRVQPRIEPTDAAKTEDLTIFAEGHDARLKGIYVNPYDAFGQPSKHAAWLAGFSAAQLSLKMDDQLESPHADDRAIDEFAKVMKAKMRYARTIKGRGGWDDPNECEVEQLEFMLRDSVGKGDVVDIANFCMMLHQRGQTMLTPQLIAQFDAAAARLAVDPKTMRPKTIWSRSGAPFGENTHTIERSVARDWATRGYTVTPDPRAPT